MTAFDIAIVDLFADTDLCVDGIFTPATGATVACRLDITHDVQLAGLDTNGQVVSVGTTVGYQLAEIGRTVRAGETFTVGSTVYTISDQVANDGLVATVVVT